MTFIGVPEPSDSTESAASFVDGTGSGSFTHLHDPAGDVWSAFGVSRRQTFILVNDDGTTTEAGFGDLVSSVEQLAAS